MPAENNTLQPLRRFRPGAFGAMVEDESGPFVRHDELAAWLLAFRVKLQALPVAKGGVQ